MSEVMRWKLKGFIPGVEGVSKALFQPWVVPAEDFDRVTAELASANSDKEAYAQNAIDLRKRVDALQQLLNAADEALDKAGDDFALLSLDAGQRIELLERALGGMLFAFDDGVGLDWSADLLDFARKQTPTVEFKPAEGGGDD
jgi:hypothetical protein